MAPSYGTTSQNTPTQNGTADVADEERAPLLGKPGEASLGQRLHRHFTEEVSNSWGDISLLGSYVITGLLDSCSTSIWGSFLSMQTGNTVYLGLGLTAPTESTRWLRSGISIGCFCLGSYFFSRYHRFFGGGRKRWVLVSSYILQLLLIIVAALMVTLGPKTGTSGPVTVWIAVPIALVAFQSAGQAVTSRVLQFNALTGVVLTSIYVDLFSDAQLFAAPTQNVQRNQRAAAPVLLLIGAVCGGLFAHSEMGLAGALWTAVILKLFIVAAWCFWSAKPEDS